MNQNHTLHPLLNGLLLSVLALCSAAFAQNRPVTQYFYDANGNLTSTTDGLGRTTSQTYDTLDRLRRITQPPPAAAQPNPVIQLELNGQDDLTKVIDPRNLSTTYGVTGLGNVTTQTSPDTGVTTRTFDAARRNRPRAPRRAAVPCGDALAPRARPRRMQVVGGPRQARAEAARRDGREDAALPARTRRNGVDARRHGALLPGH